MKISHLVIIAVLTTTASAANPQVIEQCQQMLPPGCQIVCPVTPPQQAAQRPTGGPPLPPRMPPPRLPTPGPVRIPRPPQPTKQVLVEVPQDAEVVKVTTTGGPQGGMDLMAQLSASGGQGRLRPSSARQLPQQPPLGGGGGGSDLMAELQARGRSGLRSGGPRQLPQQPSGGMGGLMAEMGASGGQAMLRRTSRPLPVVESQPPQEQSDANDPFARFGGRRRARVEEIVQEN